MYLNLNKYIGSFSKLTEISLYFVNFIKILPIIQTQIGNKFSKGWKKEIYDNSKTGGKLSNINGVIVITERCVAF